MLCFKPLCLCWCPTGACACSLPSSAPLGTSSPPAGLFSASRGKRHRLPQPKTQGAERSLEGRGDWRGYPWSPGQGKGWSWTASASNQRRAGDPIGPRSHLWSTRSCPRLQRRSGSLKSLETMSGVTQEVFYPPHLHGRLYPPPFCPLWIRVVLQYDCGEIKHCVRLRSTKISLQSFIWKTI